MAGGWIQLYNSEYFDFIKTTYHNISIETIAHSLSMQCRYNGHCNSFYSVGEHSVLVSDRVYELSNGDALCSLYALLHDASEAIICDIPRPLKTLHSHDMSWYREEEDNIQHNLIVQFIGNFGFSVAKKFTKQADFELLATEKKQIMSEAPLDWGYLPEPLDIGIECLDPSTVKQVFLDKYAMYKDKIEAKSVNTNK